MASLCLRSSVNMFCVSIIAALIRARGGELFLKGTC